MLKRRINLKNELIAPLWDSLKKYLTVGGYRFNVYFDRKEMDEKRIN